MYIIYVCVCVCVHMCNICIYTQLSCGPRAQIFNFCKTCHTNETETNVNRGENRQEFPICINGRTTSSVRNKTPILGFSSSFKR